MHKSIFRAMREAEEAGYLAGSRDSSYMDDYGYDDEGTLPAVIIPKPIEKLQLALLGIGRNANNVNGAILSNIDKARAINDYIMKEFGKHWLELTVKEKADIVNNLKSYGAHISNEVKKELYKLDKAFEKSVADKRREVNAAAVAQNAMSNKELLKISSELETRVNKLNGLITDIGGNMTDVHTIQQVFKEIEGINTKIVKLSNRTEAIEKTKKYHNWLIGIAGILGLGGAGMGAYNTFGRSKESYMDDYGYDYEDGYDSYGYNDEASVTALVKLIQKKPDILKNDNLVSKINTYNLRSLIKNNGVYRAHDGKLVRANDKQIENPDKFTKKVISIGGPDTALKKMRKINRDIDYINAMYKRDRRNSPDLVNIHGKVKRKLLKRRDVLL